MGRALALALVLATAPALVGTVPGEALGTIAAEGGQPPSCPPASERIPVVLEGPLLVPPPNGPGEGDDEADRAARAPDYRHRLRTTPLGWPRLDLWCVWVQPPATAEPAARWDGIWLAAVERALDRWATLVPIVRVSDPEAAQIRIVRGRPPRRPDASGRLRASHGRAILVPERVRRQGQWRLEPTVTVLLGADQRPQGLEATALHELGHAFGLWGHSDGRDDAMAAAPGPRPVLELSPRDRATLRWLSRQPTSFGKPEPRPESAKTSRNSSS